MRFEIPKQFLPGFKSLVKLNTEEAALLGAVLNDFPVGGNVEDLEQSIKEIQEVNINSSVAKTIFSLGGLLINSDGDKDKLAEGLTAAFEYQTEIADSGSLKANLITLLKNAEGLKKTFKAYNLLLENANHFQSSRLITDMRIVFDENFENKSKTGVFVHQLKLEYIGDKEEKEFYVSLDGRDLLKLKSEIERALKKEKNLERDFKEINFIKFK